MDHVLTYLNNFTYRKETRAEYPIVSLKVVIYVYYNQYQNVSRKNKVTPSRKSKNEITLKNITFLWLKTVDEKDVYNSTNTPKIRNQTPISFNVVN